MDTTAMAQHAALFRATDNPKNPLCSIVRLLSEGRCTLLQCFQSLQHVQKACVGVWSSPQVTKYS